MSWSAEQQKKFDSTVRTKWAVADWSKQAYGDISLASALGDLVPSPNLNALLEKLSDRFDGQRKAGQFKGAEWSQKIKATSLVEAVRDFALERRN